MSEKYKEINKLFYFYRNFKLQVVFLDLMSVPSKFQRMMDYVLQVIPLSSVSLDDRVLFCN